MIDNYNILSTCHSENNSFSSDEPTYINETQLLFYNNDIVSLCQRPEISENDQTMRNVIKRSDNPNSAAVIIQRAYRSFKQRQQLSKTFSIVQDDANNYIQFWDKDNRRSGYSLITTISNSASDSKNSDFDNYNEEECDEAEIEEIQYHNDHIYDSIPYDLSSPDSPNKALMSRDQHSQFHHTTQRKHSMDTRNRIPHPSMVTRHRLSEQLSPHSVIVYENDLRNVKPNLYVVRNIIDKQPMMVTINNTCTTHNVCHNQSVLHHNYQRILPHNSSGTPHSGDYNHQRSPDDNNQRLNFLRKQSRIIQNQKNVTDKRMYRIGLNIFNKNPAAGINYLTKYQYIKAHPTHIAKFLLTKNGISRKAIGDYIGSISDPLALQVTKFFLRRINMKNKEVDEALRSFIFYVHLPGESQKICHLMEEFKVAYLQQNESRPQFKSDDTIMILAYAIIMLQTDAHNQSIRKTEKMTQEQFVTNLRGVDDKCDIDRLVLEQIYVRVTNKEIKTQTDHSEQVRRLNESISGGNKPADFVNRTRRFMCYCRLSEIVDDAKKNKSDSHQRDMFLFNDILLITKSLNKSRKEEAQYQCKNALILTDLRVKPFCTTNYPFGIHILNRNTNESIIKLNARCEQDQKKFMFDLSDCIFESLEMLKINYSDYATSSLLPIQNSPKISPDDLASKSPKTFSPNVGKPLPYPPRRQESLAKNDRLDVGQPICRARHQSFSGDGTAHMKNYTGNFYS